MKEHLEFPIDDAPPEQPGGIPFPWSVFVSIVFHVVFFTWIAFNYTPVAATTPAPTENLRFVELMRQPPRDFTQAPGPKTHPAALNPPLSDPTPKPPRPGPTGDQPTLRPGA